MTPYPLLVLYAALALYAAGTLVALASLFTRERGPQRLALVLMIGGWIAQTFWIGSICVRTGHPPLTNLPETASFVAWTVLAVELVLFLIYRVQAASFFVYPLVLILSSLSVVVQEPFARLDPSLRSSLFTAHLLFSTLGVSALFIGLAFTLLSYLQDRALKQKTRGRLWEMVPSLNVLNVVGYRSLAVGFSIYTLGILTGIMWSYRTTAGPLDFRVKQIGAVVAWILFATILQSYITGAFRARRTVLISAGAFIATLVAILGIHHG